MAGRSPAALLVDVDGNVIVYAPGDNIAAGDAIGVVGRTVQNIARWLKVDDEGRLSVTPQPPVPPPGTTPFQVAVSEAQLDVGSGGQVASPHTTLGPIIGSGVSLTLQTINAGTEGDSSENGSVVEIYWREGGGPTDHLIERIYIMGETVQITLPDVTEARDGTAFTGDGSTTRIVVVRRRLSVAALEVDFVVRGFTE